MFLTMLSRFVSEIQPLALAQKTYSSENARCGADITIDL
jgi:hypothetical protein